MFFAWFSCCLLVVCFFLFLWLFSSAGLWLNFRLPLPSSSHPVLMDHFQGRAFHHHLARAIMHLNHLAGLLPFFEPSIEFDDGMPPPNLRGEHPIQRGLHTFAPLPSASTSPTMTTQISDPFRSLQLLVRTLPQSLVRTLLQPLVGRPSLEIRLLARSQLLIRILNLDR